MTTESVLDVHGESIDPIWAAEFRGFFWGEGHLGASIVKGFYRIQAVVNLRRDDGEVLREFQSRLGGSLSLTHNVSQRYMRLNVAALRDCQRIARLLGGGSNIPFGKRRQLTHWTELLEIKAAAGGTQRSRYTPAQHARMRELVQAIQALRNWNE